MRRSYGGRVACKCNYLTNVRDALVRPHQLYMVGPANAASVRKLHPIYICGQECTSVDWYINRTNEERRAALNYIRNDSSSHTPATTQVQLHASRSILLYPCWPHTSPHPVATFIPHCVGNCVFVVSKYSRIVREISNARRSHLERHITTGGHAKIRQTAVV